MERGNSTQSIILSRGSSVGSHYMVESGLYMTSFAATIFIAALITVGVLLVTLLITLTVMLESCENKSAGIIRLGKASDDHEYCKVFALHAELNKLEAEEFPSVCRAHTMQYIQEQYHLDLNFTMRVAEDYFGTSTPNRDALDVVLMDIDDIFLPQHSSVLQFNLYIGDKGAEELKHPMHMFLSGLHMKLRTSGWSLIFFTRKPEKERNATTGSLISAGYGGWSSLIMRSDDELPMESWEYISERRIKLHNQGFRIASVISSQMDALIGPCLGKRNFKLPNPIYYKLEQRIKGV
ncbi:HAD superfamily, subfamily IIIB acid phosphatase isoform X2 [Tasmannia lanceolata]|uniref:HAD superfamily, subfamily IIIB acid phosphatase isoform X2 n=1 Tax=Tasmannia lanceolata TaxID=3420 RepID=UPI00406459B7